MNQISHENVIAVFKADQLRDAQGLHMLDFILIDGKAYYGAFQRINGAVKVGLGYVMAKYDPGFC